MNRLPRPRTTLAVACALTLGAFAGAGCVGPQRARFERSVADVLIPPEQEKQLGLQVKQELEQKEKIQYLEDPVVNGYVQEVTGKLLPFARRDRPDVTWTVKVINDPKTVNAFATPGGYLYVYSGLLLAADDTAEVAGVLGHEAGHVVGRHSARQMVNAFGVETLASLALGKNPGAAGQLAAGLAGKTALLAYSRGDETEADEYGARYASGAGYDPRGIATFFAKLDKGAKQPGWASFLSTHPASADRVEHVNRYVTQQRLGGTGGRGGSDLAKIKERIKAIPAPPAAPRGK